MTTLLVHGGVSGTPKPPVSLRSAFTSLDGSAVDLVERALIALEDEPDLNAGYGSVLDRDGNFELEAGIADGTTGRAAGVANVTVRHPITLARRVLEQTPHVLLTGEGARAFGADLETLERTTGARYERYERAKASGELDSARFGSPEHVDTVGAVACTSGGDLAAGSSTGGVFGMLPGRVGDAPIFGAGFYASEVAAAVGTGVGELFLRSLACAEVGHLIESGRDPQEACEEMISILSRNADVPVGILAIGSNGAIGAAYRGGSWDVEGPDGPIEPVKLD